MLLGTQYYRAPFPERRFWKEDLAGMVDAGLNAVQLWACWGWIEAEPGNYRFDDYDELIDEAAKVGLQVVVSTIAEIQPFWIHREIPDSNMVDHMGHMVRSSLRRECNVGLTPGGCFDHPEVSQRLRLFLNAIAKRYSSSNTVTAWDCWNETRWAVHSDGYVCYCEHTLTAFREWLESRYGDLSALGDAWHRRYTNWADVMPGKCPGRPYTDTVEFEAFLTWRSARHAAFRAEAIRQVDGNHPVFAHCGKPAVFSSGMDFEQAVSRGNDFDLAEVLDGFGCSHFPAWEGYSTTELGTRIEAIRSAVGEKEAWVSELQGGGACAGFGVWPPVDPSEQQRWIWGAYGRGIKTVLFWCWRDEVFGRESSGFGIVGSDGQSAGRVERLARTGSVLREYHDMLDRYAPDAPQIGVLFSQASYQLEWAEDGNKAQQASGSVTGWLRVLERTQLPYNVVDSGRPASLDGLRLVVLPWPLVVPPAMAAALVEWVRAGGTLVTESELDAFDERGIYRYSHERPLAMTLGIKSRGRRELDAHGNMAVLSATNDETVIIPSASWLEVLDESSGTVLSRSAAGEVIAVRQEFGHGSVIALGSFPGLGYVRSREPGLEEFVRDVARTAEVQAMVEVEPADGELVQWRCGLTGSARLLFITSEMGGSKVTVRVRRSLLGQDTEMTALVGETPGLKRNVADAVEFDVSPSSDGIAVLRWEAKDDDWQNRGRPPTND